MYDFIEITGANEHNLKNVSVKIPKNKLVAITGPSGSGKSTLAFDILQRECQRQYMESMGLVTDGMNKVQVSSIVGLSPSISISQGLANRNPRSTVGTFTEILTYLRLLYAKCGTRVCPKCNDKILPIFAVSDQEGLSRNKDYISCPSCHQQLEKLTMASFSFNKAEGFCQSCSGLGEVNDIDPRGIVDENLTLAEGGVHLWKGVMANHYVHVLKEVAKHYNLSFDVNKKIKDYDALEKLIFYEGVNSEKFRALYPGIKAPKRVSDGYFEGILTYLKKKSAEAIRKGSKNKQIESCFKRMTCPDCEGTRLNQEGRSVTLANRTLVEVSTDTIDEIRDWILSLTDYFGVENEKLLIPLVTDILKRIDSVSSIGLGYLTLDRSIKSLSGGEGQRLRMASLMDSGLTGVLYILDEPTTGLHPKDTQKILKALKRLRDIGNTVLVIEHDMTFVSVCDYIIDFGPSSGIAGGEIVAKGKPTSIKSFSGSQTGIYIDKTLKIATHQEINQIHALKIINAHANNLKSINVSIPLNNFVTLTGVSGSGKSTLIFDVLSKGLKGNFDKVDRIEGLEYINNVVEVNQQRIGKSSRSTVATYTDVFSLIRTIFAKEKGAKERHLKSSHFSFNVKGGRCEKCQGLGSIPLDMHFLDDIEVICPECQGKRFNRTTLEVTFKGFNISQILDQTVRENMILFEDYEELYHRLSVLEEVGLGYLTLGQTTSTLSGGECQRIKLSKEVGRISKKKTLYIFDEPTTGLHPSDVDKLLLLLRKLIKKGHSVIVIEHSLEMIAQSDWIIDLGPEGGANGGWVIAEGVPLEIAMHKDSYTGHFMSI